MTCKHLLQNDTSYLGCKPFQGKILEIEILCSSDSVFSPDSEYGFEKVIGCTWTLYMTEKLISANLRNFEKNLKMRRKALLDSSN